jgi:CRP-like cAMP-binding protein
MATNPSPNLFLACLAQSEFDALRPHLEDIHLPSQTVLFETGDHIKRVYFPLSGVVSLVVDLRSGETIEAAMIGRESLVGASSAFDGQVALNRAVIQVQGEASRSIQRWFAIWPSKAARSARSCLSTSSSF